MSRRNVAMMKPEDIISTYIDIILFDFGALQFFFMQLKHLPMGLFSAFLKPFKAFKS